MAKKSKPPLFFSQLNGQHPITVTRQGARYAVKYGEQVNKNLQYVEAAHELGECLFHSMQCAGFLDDSK